ncbi:MAG: transporter, partial [Bacteroides sp.]
MLKFLKDWTLPIAMLIGGVGYPLFTTLSFLTPALIFVMLLLTFCKVSPQELRPKRLHLWLLLIQAINSMQSFKIMWCRNDYTIS